jgi:hypothetical protein
LQGSVTLQPHPAIDVIMVTDGKTLAAWHIKRDRLAAAKITAAGAGPNFLCAIGFGFVPHEMI